MSRKNTLFLIIGFLFSLALAACGASSTPAPTAPPPSPTPTPAVAAVPATPLTGEHTYVVVPSDSEARYLAKEEFFKGALAKLGIKAGLADVVGKTQDIEGEIHIDFDNLSAPLSDTFFTVNIATLKTDQNRRDKWIRDNGPRLASYPLAKFQATAIENAPASYKQRQEATFQLVGDLTIRKITRPVSFDVSASVTGDTLKGVATTRLLMSDFGIEPPSFANTLSVQDEFGLEIKITARDRQR